jgi:hypothetical protein
MMGKHLQKLAFLAVGLALVLASCAPIPKKSGALAADIAREEMRRRGWKRIEVYQCVLRDGSWVVTLGTRGARRGVDLAWVIVSSNGSVVDVDVSDR